MKKTKYLGLVLAVSLVFTSVFAGCTSSKSNENPTSSSDATSTNDPKQNINVTGVPLVKDTQTLKIATVVKDGEPASKDIKFWKNIESETNVRIEWVDTLASAWKDKKGIIMASGDLPDAFIGTNNFTDADLLNYSASGKFISIENYIDDFMPNFSAYLKNAPNMKKSITAPDGHIYGVPTIDEGYTFTTARIAYINKKWLDKLNLQVPTTIEELENVLKAFKEGDPNGNGKADEIPWSFMKDQYASNWLSSFGIYDQANANRIDAHIFVEDGEVKYSAIQPGYKEGLKWLHKLYSQGLIDKEVFTQDSKVFNAKVKSSERIVGYLEGWRSTAWALDADDDEYVAVAPLKGPSGEAAWPTWSEPFIAPYRTSFVVTSACKNPELALRWADNLLSDDNSLQINTAQIFGEHIEKQADGMIKQLRPIDWNRPGEYNLAPGNRSKLCITTKDMVEKVLTPPPVAQEKWPLDKMYAPYVPKTITYLPDIFYNADESQKLIQYRTDINPYVAQQYAKWILQGGIDAEWDAYVKKLNDMKLDDMLAVYQKALDRLNSTK